MSTISPPVSLDNPDNERRLDYVQNVASQPDYEITEVSSPWFCSSAIVTVDMCIVARISYLCEYTYKFITVSLVMFAFLMNFYCIELLNQSAVQFWELVLIFI